MSQAYKCDDCGKLEYGEPYVHATIHRSMETLRSNRYDTEFYDLCLKCGKKRVSGLVKIEIKFSALSSAPSKE